MTSQLSSSSSSWSYRFVSDYSADIPPTVLQQQDVAATIALARNTVTFGNDSMTVDQLTMKEIFDRIDHEGTFPTTSAPPFEEFLRIYQRITSETPESTHVISIHPPEKLSATVKTAHEARNHLPPEKRERIHVINSHQGSVGLGLLLHELIFFSQQHQHHADFPEPRTLATLVEEWGKSIALMGAIKTLEYLLKGGRIGRAKYLVASLMNYQPLFQLANDEVIPLGRTRNRQKALDTLIKHLKDHIAEDLEPPFNTVLVGHVLAENEAMMVSKRIKDQVPHVNVEITTMGTLVGIHTGPGTIALAFHVKTPPLP